MNSTRHTSSPPFDEDAPRRPSSAPRVWAGAVLLLAAVGLVGLGGCFLIGDLVIANPAIFNPCPDPGAPMPTPSWDAANLFLFIALGVLGFACFVGGAIVFVVGFRGLCRVLFGDTRAAA